MGRTYLVKTWFLGMCTMMLATVMPAFEAAFGQVRQEPDRDPRAEGYLDWLTGS